MGISAVPARFKADFGLFRPFLACFGRFRHVLAVPAISVVDRYDPIWLDSGRISPVWRELKPIRCELSRVGANQRKKKKKKLRRDTDTQAITSNSGTTPSQPCSCFLGYKPKGIKLWSLLPHFLKSLQSLVDVTINGPFQTPPQ